jgi:NADH-quinone oxidoreductase subunit A
MLLFVTNNIFLERGLLFGVFGIIFTIIYLYMCIKYSFFISPKRIDLEKTSSYECGFNPYIQARTKFNFKFYTLSIIFLIFDIEIVLLLPISLALFTVTNVTTLGIIYLFFLFLFLGLLLEMGASILDY